MYFGTESNITGSQQLGRKGRVNFSVSSTKNNASTRKTVNLHMLIQAPMKCCHIQPDKSQGAQYRAIRNRKSCKYNIINLNKIPLS